VLPLQSAPALESVELQGTLAEPQRDLALLSRLGLAEWTDEKAGREVRTGAAPKREAEAARKKTAAEEVEAAAPPKVASGEEEAAGRVFPVALSPLIQWVKILRRKRNNAVRPARADVRIFRSTPSSICLPAEHHRPDTALSSDEMRQVGL